MGERTWERKGVGRKGEIEEERDKVVIRKCRLMGKKRKGEK